MVTCLMLVSSACVVGQDWAQWRGANRDGHVTGFAAPEKWPTALTQKWKVTVGAGDATPALVGDRLYVFARQGADEVTLCLNAADGKELWRDKYAAQAVTGPGARHPGPRSSPAVADGKVVTLGVGGVVSCLGTADGKVQWRRDEFPKVVPRFFAAMSPVIVDKMAIAHLGGPGNGAIIAFDLATGEPKWKWTAEGPEYASPVVMTVEGTKQIVTLTEKSVVGIGVADGKLLWQVPFAPQRRSSNAVTPTVNGQTVIYSGARRGTKAVKIEKAGDGFAPRELWSNAQVSTGFNTPVLKDGLLFGFSDRGNLFCINAETGKTAWTDTVGHGRGFAAVLAAGSVILALPSTSELIAFKPSGQEYSQLARIKVADTPTYAHPVVAGNRIFVKDSQTLAMWAIE